MSSDMAVPATPMSIEVRGFEEGSPAEHAPAGNSTFTWESVEYGVGTGKKTKQILHGLSGSLGGGEVCAILGPSGAGKSSLLNILAGRIRHKGGNKRVSGIIRMNGAELVGTEIRKRIAYVMQEDLLFATSTPREALMFSARLRLPKTMPMEEKAERVEAMLSDLGLLECADTYIGNDQLRGISGGEKKRTSIGIELVMNPSLVFLDEPTSGLDSFAAHAVIRKLRGLALGGRRCNVLCTIHQPSSEVFHTFHKCMIMCKGREFFYGTISGLSAALAAQGRGCPNEFNLADHAIDLVQTESLEGMQALAAKMKGDKSTTAAAGNVKMLDASNTGVAVASEEVAEGFFMQLMLLTTREALFVYRNKPALIASILAPLILNLFFATLFANVGDVDAADNNIKSHFGAVAQVAISGMFGAAQPLLLRFPLERGIFLREYATSMYSTPAYFISKSIIELPQQFLNALLVWVAFYWIADLQGQFILHVLTFWISGLAAGGTALLMGSIAANPEVALQAAPPVFVLQLLFAGVFINTDQMPAAVRWIQYIASLKYGVNLHIIVEFGSETTKNWSPSQRAAAEALMAQNGIYEDDWWVYMIAIIGLFIFYRAMAIFCLRQRAIAFF